MIRRFPERVYTFHLGHCTRGSDGKFSEQTDYLCTVVHKGHAAKNYKTVPASEGTFLSFPQSVLSLTYL